MSDAELVNRIEKLERDNRRLKSFAFGVLILAAALGGIYAAQPTPRKIAAREFDVLDESGRVRAKMGAQPNGLSFIQVEDAQGHPRAALTTAASGAPGVDIFDPQGHELASMDTTESGGGLIAISDSQQQERVLMTPADSSGASGIWLYDAYGKRRAVMRVSATGAPSIHLSDGQGFSTDLGSTATEIPTTGGARKTSAASIVMSGKDHRVIWQAP